MANRFEFLVPDIAGAVSRGRAEVRQADRERLADQELRGQLERQNQFRQLAGQAYGAGSPSERQQFVSQAAAADPQGAMALDRQMGSNEDRKQALKINTAQMLMSVPLASRPALYQKMVPTFRQAGMDASDVYTPELDTMMQAFASGGQQGQRPSNIQEWEHYSQLSQPDQQRYIEMKRAQQTFVPEIGGVRTVVRPGVAGGDTTMQPLSTIEREAGATERLSGASQQGKAKVELLTAGPIAAATTGAKETAQSQAKIQEEQRQNQVAFGVYQTARDNLQAAMQGTATNPLAGRVPAVTSAQQIAEGAQAVMAPVLKQLFRTAGEGTFTEKDQQLLLDMLPKRTDHPAAGAAKLQMIDQLVASKLGVVPAQRMAEPVAGPSRQPPASAQQPTSGAPSFATEAEAEAAGLRPGTRVVIGGVPGTWQ